MKKVFLIISCIWGLLGYSYTTDGFVLEAKRIDEILPNEFHISSISYGNEKELTEKILLEAKADVSKYVDKKLVNEALDDLAVQSTAFFKKIDALTNLPRSCTNPFVWFVIKEPNLIT